MSNSGIKVNYAVRPAKNIERKMMRDFFSRMFIFDELENYHYIGFGSKYFTDFILFHKTLNFKKMTSIEIDRQNTRRYDFNKPYNCIEILHGKSSDVLPSINFNEMKHIVWLDYDSKFDESMLSDILILSERLTSGSIFSLSFDCEVPKIEFLKQKYSNISDNYYKRYFQDIFGERHIIDDLDDRGWSKDNKFKNFINIKLREKIISAISRRNQGLSDSDKYMVEQFFYFTYSDGNTPMSTIGWIIFQEKDRQKFDQLNFTKFKFYSNQVESPYLIKTSNLTMKEVHLLMSLMPNETDFSEHEDIIPKKQIEAFCENYQYFPSFNEVEAY